MRYFLKLDELMYKIIISPKAETLLKEISAYIAQDNLYYSNLVLKEIAKSIDTLKNFPLIGRELEAPIRQIVNPRYKFKVIYQVM